LVLKFLALLEEGGSDLYIVSAVLFLLGIVSISFQQLLFSVLVLVGFVILIILDKEKRFIASLLLMFLFGFIGFMASTHFVGTLTISKESKILLNRTSLVLIIIVLVTNYFFFKKKVSLYNAKPDWGNPIVLPFHRVNTFWFWLIGIAVNAMIYLFFILQKDLEYIQALFWFCLLFSLINAVFEEVIWRGILLSALHAYTSTGFAIVVTSIGFGLLHLAIGFSFGLCLLIAMAGVIYAVITLKTNSIYPSIVFHFIVNIGMVYSGLIL